jgi:DNA-binding NarL/FixJ family response regulator
MITLKKIFIVEDDDEVRTGSVFLINFSNEYVCTGFSNAEDALRAIKVNKPDIVLMDVNLPGMNGIECTKLIKQASRDIQVMMFTVYENHENVFKALEAGASGYLLKQSTPNELLDAIRLLNAGGAPMSTSIARMVVSSFNKHAAIIDEKYHLSDREKEILDLLSEGYRYQDIADKLFINISTVRSHIYHIYEKLHVSNRTEALNKIKGE